MSTVSCPDLRHHDALPEQVIKQSLPMIQRPDPELFRLRVGPRPPFTGVPSEKLYDRVFEVLLHVGS